MQDMPSAAPAVEQRRQAAGTERQFYADDRRKALIDRALCYLDCGLAVCLTGHAGCGKTAMARHLGARRGRPVVWTAGDAAQTSTDLLGETVGEIAHRTRDRFVHSVEKTATSRKTLWRDGPLVEAMLAGATFIYDEYTRAPAAANNPLLTAIEERAVSLSSAAREGRIVSAAEGFGIILTTNPDEYVGTNPSADALEDRLVVIQLPVADAAYETGVVSASTGLGEPAARRIVDIVRATLGDGAESLRPALLIATVCATVDLPADDRNPEFRALLEDVLASRRQKRMAA